MALANRRRPWLRPLLLLILILELLGASTLLRSDLFAREPVNEVLSRLGQRLGGTFQLGDISPHGVTGVAVSELRFVPNSADLPAFEIRDLVVFPSIDRLLAGELALDRAVVGHLSTAADAQQLRALAERLRGGPAATPASGRARAGRLPDTIDVRHAEVRFADDRLRGGETVVTATNLILRRDETRTTWTVTSALVNRELGTAHLEATLRGGVLSAAVELDDTRDLMLVVAAQELGLPTSASVYARSLALDENGAELRVSDVRVSGLDRTVDGLEGWRLAGLTAREARVDRRGDVAAQLGDASVLLTSPTGSAAIPVARAELWRGEAAGPYEVTARLGRSEAGYVDIAALPSLDEGGWIVSAQARRYDVGDWAGLLSDEAPLRLVEGLYSGSATAVVDSLTGRIDLSVDGTIEQGQAVAPFIAARPLAAITAGLRGDVRFEPDRRRLSLTNGRILLEGLPLHVDADLSWASDTPRLTLEAHLDDVSADQLRRALPEGLAPSLDGVALRGTLSAAIHADLDTARPEEAVLDLQLDSSRLEVIDFGPDVPVDRLNDELVLAVSTTDGVGRSIGPGMPGWVSYDEVEDVLVPALVGAEDGRFFAHDGFDWRAIEASVELNLRERRIVRGGSTISQQVVRSLFLGHERTLGRKFEEAFLTWQLEQLVPKRRIMELYVNAVHWGPGLYGVSEAAAAYFRRRPQDLEISEAAFLASILPNPNYFGTQYARHIVTPSRREKVCNIVRIMQLNGVISASDARRTCNDAEQGVVSVVPAPEWLLEHPAPADGPDLPVAVVLGGVTLTAMR